MITCLWLFYFRENRNRLSNTLRLPNKLQWSEVRTTSVVRVAVLSGGHGQTDELEVLRSASQNGVGLFEVGVNLLWLYLVFVILLSIFTLTDAHCRSLPLTAAHCRSLLLTAAHCRSLPHALMHEHLRENGKNLIYLFVIQINQILVLGIHRRPCLLFLKLSITLNAKHSAVLDNFGIRLKSFWSCWLIISGL